MPRPTQNREKRLSQRELYKLDDPVPPRPPSQEFLWNAQLITDPDNFKAFNPHAHPRDPVKEKKRQDRKDRKDREANRRKNLRKRRV